MSANVSSGDRWRLFGRHSLHAAVAALFLLYTAKIKNPPESRDICGKIIKKREKDLTF
jgi:hypothetical protein